MTNLSRRSVMLTGAAASLAAGSLAAEADQAPSFPAEYHECCNRWIDYERWRLLRFLETIDDEDDPDFAVEREADREAMAPYRAAKARLFERPVRTLVDVVALLRLRGGKTANLYAPTTGRRPRRSQNPQGRRAARGLAVASAEDLIRLEAEYRARREAAERSAPGAPDLIGSVTYRPRDSDRREPGFSGSHHFSCRNTICRSGSTSSVSPGRRVPPLLGRHLPAPRHIASFDLTSQPPAFLIGQLGDVAVFDFWHEQVSKKAPL